MYPWVGHCSLSILRRKQIFIPVTFWPSKTNSLLSSLPFFLWDSPSHSLPFPFPFHHPKWCKTQMNPKCIFLFKQPFSPPTALLAPSWPNLVGEWLHCFDFSLWSIYPQPHSSTQGPCWASLKDASRSLNNAQTHPVCSVTSLPLDEGCPYQLVDESHWNVLVIKDAVLISDL